MKKDNLTKNSIDSAGRVLAKSITDDAINHINSEDILDLYRESHLSPLTELTIGIQSALNDFGGEYYIAQRLKRKPQIIRKLRRFSVRLTQLQDIGGCRIIVDKNGDLDDIANFLRQYIKSKPKMSIYRETDYREKGRDDTGYRALHFIIDVGGSKIELQLRSGIQHYWAESIERTSVVYGYHLKEGQGDPKVIEYFKYLSSIFYQIENTRLPSVDQKADLEKKRRIAQQLIEYSDNSKVFDTLANDSIIKTLIEKETRNPSSITNWIIVFDWKTGQFVTWDIVDRSPDIAMKMYTKYEEQFPEEEKFEVVMIGSSSITTIKKTHSHYFGVQRPDNILSGLEKEISELSNAGALDLAERQILEVLFRRRHWATKPVAVSTLLNHFCRDVPNFNDALEHLISQEFLIRDKQNGPVALNIKKRNEIERQIG